MIIATKGHKRQAENDCLPPIAVYIPCILRIIPDNEKCDGNEKAHKNFHVACSLNYLAFIFTELPHGRWPGKHTSGNMATTANNKSSWTIHRFIPFNDWKGTTRLSVRLSSVPAALGTQMKISAAEEGRM